MTDAAILTAGASTASQTAGAGTASADATAGAVVPVTANGDAAATIAGTRTLSIKSGC